jgi:hypothetical protein
MNRTRETLQAVCLLIICSLCVPAGAQQVAASNAPQTKGAGGPPGVLWRDPVDIASRNLLYGPGGKEHAPTGKFKFVKEDKKGTNPKFDVVDEQGVRWRVKVGPEARAETAASRLLWAAGYFADEDYYLPELRVEGIPKLSRGREFVSKDGVVRGAGLERHVAGRKKMGPWSWSKNPFVGSKELGGLEVMMALMNNWDAADKNNGIYDEGGERHYSVIDVGATFGRMGGILGRSKDNLKDYSGSTFVQKTTPEYVDFSAFRFQHIPRADAKWIGELLSKLSADQIRDCFRAAGYSPEEVEGYTKAVQARISALSQL